MKIFILEDAPSRMRQFRYYLKELFPEYTIHHAVEVDRAIKILEENEGEWDKIFLDHDLEGNVFVPSSHRQTGYTLAKYIKENNIKYKECIIHTLNPVGAKNIQSILTDGKVISFPVLVDIFKGLINEEKK